MASFLEVLLIFLFSGSSSDLLSYVDPKVALESLGETTDEANLKALIEGASSGEATESPAAPADFDAGEAKRAIQNLASSVAAVRDRARESLIAMGAGIRPLLENVVANDPRRAEEAKKVLEQLTAVSKASAQRHDVARIVAMRLVGDQKLKGLLPAVQGQVDSESPFVRAAARKVAALLEGKELPEVAARPWATSLGAVEALPTGTKFLARVSAGFSGKAGDVRIDALLRGMMATFGGGGPDSAEVDRRIQEITQQVVNFAVNYGNVRLDTISVANVGGMGPRGAGLGLIVSGEYEKSILEQGLESNPGFWTVSEVEGKKVFTSMFARIIPLDEHHVLILPQEASLFFPLEEYLVAFREGKKPLSSDARWSKFLGTLADGAAARALALTDASLMSEAWEEMDREIPTQEVRDALHGMKEIEGEVRLEDSGKASYRAEATFEDSKKATDMAEFVKSGIQMGISELEREIGQMGGSPFEAIAKKFLEVMKAIHVVGEGKRGILRGDVDLNDLLLPFFMMTGVRSAPTPVR